jgi:hypothetical protein
MLQQKPAFSRLWEWVLGIGQWIHAKFQWARGKVRDAWSWLRGGGIRRSLGLARMHSVRMARRAGGFLVAAAVRIGDLRFAFALKVLGITVAGLMILFAAGIYFAVRYPSTQIPAHDPVDRIVYLDQGWGPSESSRQRQGFYYTPQGTSLNNLRYNWFTHLEVAWGYDRFANVENMRALGFLVDYNPTNANPQRLPVGFARHFDTVLGDEVLDITCAACHTGELDLTTKAKGRVGIRIDGGPAMHAFTAMKVGHFGPNLLAAMAATWLNPFKFTRFAHRILGDGYPKGRAALFSDFVGVFFSLLGDGITETSRDLYPVEEGFGRTDAIGRISNRVFAKDLDASNYRQSSAPVSYPAIWDIWKFDWVQYTASVAQPMARNLGESLGTGVDLHLTDPYGRPLPPEHRFTSSAMVDNLYSIEQWLHDLKPPKWPEDLLGPIDHKKADRGKDLFYQHCAHCHEPCEYGPEERAVLTPDKKPGQSEWRLNYIPVEDVGTDPAAALHFVNTRVDLSKTGLTSAEIRPYVEQLYNEQEARRNAYRKRVNLPPVDHSADIARKLDEIDIRSVSIGAGLNYIGILLRDKYYRDHNFPEEKRRDYNGFGALDLPEVRLVYKARPLAGVWATAPYLHNGSVATIYEMLIPADQRRKKFFVGRREFDPVQVGLYPEPLSKNGFWLDTSIPGNMNIGHEFRAGYTEWTPCSPPSHGVIGPELTEEERWAIIEYLKIRDDDSAPQCKPDPPPPVCPIPGTSTGKTTGATK